METVQGTVAHRTPSRGPSAERLPCCGPLQPQKDASESLSEIDTIVASILQMGKVRPREMWSLSKKKRDRGLV